MVFKVYCILFISDVYITSASFSSLSFLPAICHHHLMFFSHALFSSLSWSQISSCLVFPIAQCVPLHLRLECDGMSQDVMCGLFRAMTILNLPYTRSTSNELM